MDNKNRHVVPPSKSFISTRPTSKKLDGRRLTEFSLSTIFFANGTVGAKSLQLQWSDETPLPTPPSTSAGIYDDVIIVDRPSDATLTNSRSNATSLLSRRSFHPPPTDVFLTSKSTSRVSTSSAEKMKTSSNDTPLFNQSQPVSWISVTLCVIYFENPELIVRNTVTKEVSNDLTILEVLQHLLQCTGVNIDTSVNSELGRLFRNRPLVGTNVDRYEEVDYLHWRYAHLAEMTNKEITFMLDFTYNEETPISSSSNSAASIHSSQRPK